MATTRETLPRLAAYARYSSELQSGQSCADQISSIQRYAQRTYGVEVPDAAIFQDEAKSGSTTVGRTAYLLLVNTITRSNGHPPFDIILVEDFSRLSRDLSEINKPSGMAPVWNIQVIDCSSGQDITGDAVLYRGIENQNYLKRLKAGIRRGLAERFARGYHAGSKIFGFTSEPVPDPSGRLDRFTKRPILLGHKPIIDETQAPVVRRIFALAEAGESPKSIARRLNADGIPTPSSSYQDGAKRKATHWSASTVLSLLRNRKYAGVWTYLNKKNVAPFGKIRRPCPTETVTQERPELRLVSPEVWQRVQTLIDERSVALRPRQEQTVRNPQTGEPKLNKMGQPIIRKGLLAGREPGTTPATPYGRPIANLLHGLVFCGVCGGPISIVKLRLHRDGQLRRYLGCQRRHCGYGAPCANAGVFRLADLEGALADALHGYFSNAKLAEAHHKRFLARLAEQRKQQTADETKAQADLAAADRDIARIKTAILAGILGETTATMLRDAEGRKAEA